jgi:hypothetical protein
LLTICWRTGECGVAILIPICKKWNGENCKNYWGISLLCAAYILRAKIFSGRISNTCTLA